jgi:AcrR family transcriptional regulator
VAKFLRTKELAIAVSPERSSGLSPNLTKERVLQAAISLADEGGIDSVSMRNLARRLNAGVMSLYYYVKDKSEILHGMVDLVVREIELAGDDVGWKPSIRRTAVSARQALLRHPWAANIMFSAGDGPGRLDYMESILATLRQAGFSADLTHRAYHLLDSHIIGFTLWEASIPFNAMELTDLADAFLKELPRDRYPYLAEHIDQHSRGPADDSKSAFEFGLDLILDSLERERRR